LFFNITVSLPKGKDIATIPRFETHLPKFGHFIGALEKNAFGSICLHSDDSPIVVEVRHDSPLLLVVVTLTQNLPPSEPCR
jgi:hypothetical protein